MGQQQQHTSSNKQTSRAIGSQKPGGGHLLHIFLAVLLVVPVAYNNLSILKYLSDGRTTNYADDRNEPTRKTTTRAKPKIAVMSSFVPNRNVNPPPRLNGDYFDHIINKACYSYIWGYDFIFNTTYGFDDTYPKWHWLDFGAWNKVPHLKSRIRDYDWIFYTDTDFIIQDIMRPLESFVNEWELYGKKNVQLFLPTDRYGPMEFLFSNFAFLIRNSNFGHSILNYWDDFVRVRGIVFMCFVGYNILCISYC